MYISSQGITIACNSYLCTPLTENQLVAYFDVDGVDNMEGHDYGWNDYRVDVDDWSCYPDFLDKLVEAGIAFTWEYLCTEDMSYFAYNFPTEGKPQNYGTFNSRTKRKNFPRMSKKALKHTEQETYNNLLLLNIGIKPHGQT